MATKEQQNVCFCTETVKTINKKKYFNMYEHEMIYVSTLPLETYQLSSEP